MESAFSAELQTSNTMAIHNLEEENKPIGFEVDAQAKRWHEIFRPVRLGVLQGLNKQNYSFLAGLAMKKARRRVISQE